MAAILDTGSSSHYTATVESKELTFEVPGEGPVSALLETPPGAAALCVLAHGAGAGMRHPAMKALAMVLHGNGIATFRYQFPYMEKRSRRPDRPETAVATVRAAVTAARAFVPKLPIFAGGRSFGGRMTTTAAADGGLEGVRGLVCFSFPLHPAKKPAVTRADHLERVAIPTLFLQGTRDDLCELALFRPIVKRLGPSFVLHELQGVDHGYDTLKSSGRTGAAVLKEVSHVVAAFVAHYR